MNSLELQARGLVQIHVCISSCLSDQCVLKLLQTCTSDKISVLYDKIEPVSIYNFQVNI